ncbi:helix-turn-helix transcriptional regulator [Neorhizobium sp. JUb45]|uniref:helix-turn-helix transcriptional regulator n=1 Tax=Neorhizobium sp. JUb45 TaxID=2485113 RepID=UPI00105225A9|nr:helix-turn-helix transcriptional regulator [Neorhizobium sp. JUb45]
MADNDISDDSFADLVGGVSVSGVKKWRYGERVPRPEQMRRIAEVTHGAVCPNDFILVAEAAE